MQSNEEIVKEIIYNTDGSFDIITDKTIYKDCRYNKKNKSLKEIKNGNGMGSSIIK